MARSTLIPGYPRALSEDEDGFDVEGIWLDEKPADPREPFYGHGQVLMVDPETGMATLEGATIMDYAEPETATWDSPLSPLRDTWWWTDDALGQTVH